MVLYRLWMPYDLDSTDLKSCSNLFFAHYFEQTRRLPNNFQLLCSMLGICRSTIENVLHGQRSAENLSSIAFLSIASPYTLRVITLRDSATDFSELAFAGSRKEALDNDLI